MSITPRILLCVCFFCVYTFSFEQTINLSAAEIEKAKHYATLSDLLYASKPDSAIYYGLAAICIFEDAHLIRDVINVRNGLSYIYSSIKKDYAAVAYNNDIAYRLALQYLADDDEVGLIAINNYAIRIVEEQQQDYRGAIAIYDKLLERSLSPYLLGGFSYNIATRYFELGDFKSALAYYKNAADYYTQLNAHNAPKYLQALIELGRTYNEISRYDLADQTYQQVLNNQLDIPANDPSILRCSYYMAVNYSAMNKDDLALRKLDFLLKILNDRQTLYYDAWYLWGIIQQKKKNIAGWQLAVRKIQNLPENFDPTKVARYQQLEAELLWQQHQPTAAFQLLDSAMVLLYPSAKHRDISLEEDILTSCQSPYELAKVLRTKAQWLAIAEEKQPLHEALNIYYLLSELRDQARKEFQSKQAQLFLLASSKEFHEEALNLLFKLKSIAPEKSWKKDALFFIEKSKSNLILDEWQKNVLGESAELPTNYTAKLDSLEQALFLKRKLITSVGTNETRLSTQQKILQLERQIHDLELKIQAAYPSYGELNNLTMVDDKQLQNQLLQDKELLVNFFAGEEWLYALFVTKSQTRLIRYPIAAYTEEVVLHFINSLRLDNPNQINDFKKLSYLWYKELILPGISDGGIEIITLLPDAYLAQIPFAALLTDTIGEFPSKLAYLVKQKEIRYGYSASVLAMQNRSQKSFDGVMGVYPIFKDSEKYQEYVDSNQKDFQSFQGKHLDNEEATKQNFFFATKNKPFEVLLFATHAQANDTSFAEPSIDFYDQSMPLSELMLKKIEANLAILSACETNTGSYQKGEGTMSLARGFTLAGIPSLITSLWAIPEDATLSLIINTMEGMEKEDSKSLALRNSQLAYLESERLPENEKSPYYWSGLIGIGNMQAISIHKKSLLTKDTFLLTSILLLLAGIIFYVAYKNIALYRRKS